MVRTAEQVRTRLKEMGYSCSLVNARFVKPIDTETLERLSGDHRLFVTMEENVLSGGYGDHVRRYISDADLPSQVLSIGIEDRYVEHGNADLLKQELGLDAESVTGRVVTKYISMMHDNR
jgi:1-deoxy-D-xylulose-5-phosphate synthase